SGLARRAGIVDVPGSASHKLHAATTPLVGGPVLLIAVAMSYLALGSPPEQPIIGVMLGGLFVVVWGTIDDRWGLSPVLKLLAQLVTAVILIAFGVQVLVTRIPWFDLALSIVWVVGLMNAFNFVDSMDGLAVGLAIIAAGFFMLVTLDAQQPTFAMLSAVLLGALLGMYYFNAMPAKVFLGDSGSQLLGFVLAAVGIAYSPAGAQLPQALTWFTPILVLGVPIFDTTLVVFSRIRRRLPVYEAHQDHTYHRLISIGIAPPRSVLSMQFGAILLSLVAFLALSFSVLVANIVFGSIVLLGALSIWYLDVIAKRELTPGTPKTTLRRESNEETDGSHS
ncbi:MAG: MraY family glycosyltransferase, partial [Anaerolineales bacterium]